MFHQDILIIVILVFYKINRLFLSVSVTAVTGLCMCGCVLQSISSNDNASVYTR